MKRTVFCLALALLLTLAACAPSTPAPSPTPTPTPAPTAAPTSTPAPELDGPYLADYDFFWDTLEDNWPFWSAAERITGVDLVHLREQKRPLAAQANSPWALYQVLHQCLRAINGQDIVSHLAILSEEDYPAYLDLYRSLSDNPHCAYLAGVLDNAASRDFYRYTPSEPTPAGETELSASGSAPQSLLTFRDYPEDKTGYVKIPTFHTSCLPVDGPLLLDYFRELEDKGYEHCILDIRGNSGGNNTYPLLNLVAPNATGPLEPTDHYMLVRGGDQARAYLESAGFDSLKPIDELPADTLPALDPGDLASATHFVTVRVPNSVKADYANVPAFSGKFWLLVDGGVYSSSEYFAILCKDAGFATVVGEPTGGDGLGMDPMISVLPKSGICFRFSVLNGLNLDGGCNEELGTVPDLLTGPGQSALTLCLDAIRAQS